MFNDDFDFYPDQRNMRFEKPMHGPPGRGGPPGHHMRHAGPMRRRMPDMPPNFRGPREPMYDDYIGPPPMGRGPHYGGNSPQPNFASPARNQQSPGNMPYPKSRGGPPMIPYPPPGFGSGGSNRGASESHSPSQHMQKHNSAAVSSVNLDFWVETTLQETGKTYYYHAKTRESSWVKPENVKIIRQDEIEQMAAAASATNENNNNTKNNHTQFAPFVPIGPMACTMPAPGIGMLPPAAYGMGPPPPFGIPLYPYGIPPPNFGSVPQVSSDMSQGSQPPKAIDKEDEEEWDEYTSVDGRVYYVHKISKISVWQKPPKKPNIEATERANAKDLDSVKTSEADSTNAMEVEEREVCDTQSGDIKNELVESEKTQEEGKRESDFENGSINMGGDEKTEHNSGHLSPHESVKIDEITDEKRKKKMRMKKSQRRKSPSWLIKAVQCLALPFLGHLTLWYLQVMGNPSFTTM